MSFKFDLTESKSISIEFCSALIRFTATWEEIEREVSMEVSRSCKDWVRFEEKVEISEESVVMPSPSWPELLVCCKNCEGIDKAGARRMRKYIYVINYQSCFSN